MVISIEKRPRRSLSFMMFLLIIISGSIPVMLITTEIASGAVLFVGDSSTYTKISYALENSTSGDTIIVSQGTYEEALTIDTDLITIIGNNTATTIIDAPMGETAITIGSNNVTLIGLKLGSGGMVVSGDNLTCSNMIINAEFSAGAFVSNVRNMVFNNVTFENIEYYGLIVKNSNALNFTGMNTTGSSGIVASFQDSTNINIMNSTMIMNSSSTCISALNVVNMNIFNSFFSSTNGSNTGFSVENGTGISVKGCDLRIIGNTSTFTNSRWIIMDDVYVEVPDANSRGMKFDTCSYVSITMSNFDLMNGSYALQFFLSDNIEMDNSSFQISGTGSDGILIEGSNDGVFNDLSAVLMDRPGSLFSIYRSRDLGMSGNLVHSSVPGAEMIDIRDSDNITIVEHMLSSSAHNTTMISASENTGNLTLKDNWFYSEDANSDSVDMENVKDIMIQNNSIEIRGEFSSGYILGSASNVTISKEDLSIYGPGSVGIQANGERIKVTETAASVSGDSVIGILFTGSKDCEVSLSSITVESEMSVGIASSGTMNDLDINHTDINVISPFGSAVLTDHPQGRLGLNNVIVNSSISDVYALHMENGDLEINNLMLISNMAGIMAKDIDSGYFNNTRLTSAMAGISFEGSVMDIVGSSMSSIRLSTVPGPAPKGSWITAIDSTVGTVNRIDQDSRLDIWNTIGIQLLTKDLEPYQGVDLEMKSWEEVIYKTVYYNTTDPDPKTDTEGGIGEMVLLDKIYNGSEIDPTIGYTNLSIHVVGNSVMTWEETFTLNTTYPHTEVFISPDIDLPRTPFNFTIRQSETKQTLFLNWDPNNDDTIEYWIYQLDPVTSQQDLVDKTNSTQTSWVSPDLGPSKQMYYWITSWDGIWESEPTSLVSGLTKDLTAPLSPEIFLGDATKDTITIRWTHPGPADLAGFIIYISRPGSPDFELLDTVGPALREYTATELEWGTTYQFRVQAFDDSDNYSPMGDVLDVTTITPLFEIKVLVMYSSEGPLADRPADNCLLELLAFNGSFIVASETDENGTASFFVNPHETYSIRAIPENAGEIDLRTGYLPALSDLVTIDPMNETVQVNFTLDYYLRFIQGTVRMNVLFGEGPRSGPVFNAAVTLLHENGTEISTDTTDADGSVFFQVSELPLRGRFRIIPPEGTGGDPEQMRSGYLEMTTNFFELTFEDSDIDLGEIFLDHYTYIPPPEDLLITSISPYGTAVDLASPIVITFNQPVETASVIMSLEITPPLQNPLYYWEGSNKTLRIEHDDMIPETDYTVTIGIGARSEEGTGFPIGYLNNTFSFRTTALPEAQPSEDDSKYIIYAIGIGAIVLVIIILIYSRISSKKKEEDEYTRSYSPFEDYEGDEGTDDEFYDEEYPDDIAEQMDDELPFEDEDEFYDEDEFEDEFLEDEEEFDEYDEEPDEFDEGEDIEDEGEIEEEEGMEEEEEMEEIEEEEPPEDPEPKPKKKKKKK